MEAFLRQASRAKQALRVVGSGLSPNGLGFSDEGMLSMALMDKVVRVDKERRQVTVQAGCRVQQLVKALEPHGLTLQNFASIREQQVGGFIQVRLWGEGEIFGPQRGPASCCWGSARCLCALATACSSLRVRVLVM